MAHPTIASAMPDLIRQHIQQRIDSDQKDHLSTDQKTRFKDEVAAFSFRVKKEYPKNDSEVRPIVVGYQMKLEETIIDLLQDKTLSDWKITVVFVTPKPVTPLSIDPEDKETWKGAIAKEVQNDPVRLHTVLGRCATVPQLMESGSNVTVHAFYPESGFGKRGEIHQEIYKSFRERENLNLSDIPMKHITDLEPEEVGAIYIMQPPGTFKASTTPYSAQENPLQVIEDELKELQAENNEQKLKMLVSITNIGAGQAVDAGKQNTFSLCSGPLSHPEVQESFNLRNNTITSGITASQPPKNDVAD